jgi:hypothetical protein
MARMAGAIAGAMENGRALAMLKRQQIQAVTQLGKGSKSALDDAVPVDLGQRVPVEPPPGAAGGDLVGYRE